MLFPISGQPTADNEEGGHPDEKPQAVVQVEEEKGHGRLYADERPLGHE